MTKSYYIPNKKAVKRQLCTTMLKPPETETKEQHEEQHWQHQQQYWQHQQQHLQQ